MCWTLHTLEDSANMFTTGNGESSPTKHFVRACSTGMMRRTTGNPTTTSPTNSWCNSLVLLRHLHLAWECFWHCLWPVTGWGHVWGLSWVLWGCCGSSESKERVQLFQRRCDSWGVSCGSGAQSESRGRVFTKHHTAFQPGKPADPQVDVLCYHRHVKLPLQRLFRECFQKLPIFSSHRTSGLFAFGPKCKPLDLKLELIS